MTKKSIYFVSPEFPPTMSGVGDHTAHLAAAIDLEGTCDVRIFTATKPALNIFPFPVEHAFDMATPRSIGFVVDVVARNHPDWLIIQYDPFGYGARFGFNPSLIVALQRIRIRWGRTKIGLIVHESFVNARDWRSSALSVMLKSQLWCLCNACEVIFTVIRPWARQIEGWFPSKRIVHLPVGSNFPLTAASRIKTRRSLNIEDSTTVLGYLGRVRGSRSVRIRHLEHIVATIKKAQAAGFEVLLVYLGRDAKGARELLGHLPLLALGPLAAQDVSKFLAAVDIFLLPIANGVSTRQTSFMCAMQHGLPIIATSGPDTDCQLLEMNERAFILIPEEDMEGFAGATLNLIRQPDRKAALSSQAEDFFLQQYTWDRIGARFLRALNVCRPRQTERP